MISERLIWKRRYESGYKKARKIFAGAEDLANAISKELDYAALELANDDDKRRAVVNAVLLKNCKKGIRGKWSVSLE